jgi:hypothetical protein
MKPADLRAYLEILREAGVRQATLSIEGDHVTVEFSPVEPEREPAGLRDRDGNAVNLDEGLPELARDPIEAANWPAKAD